ncbi:MAG: RloB family protein [Prevotella sp.]|jgi:hypothetical protein|nr:RloB family protein [Prevotella sp.]
MRQNRRIPIQVKPKYAVVVDGETEFWYIQMLKRNERLISVDLKPEIPQRKKISEQYSKVVDLSKDYDKVYWIIDFDVINKETREAKRGTKTALQELKEYWDNIEKNHKNIVVVIVNNPCFEYWLLLHFEATSKFYNSHDELIKQLKKHLSDYEKSQTYYTKQNRDIYLRLTSKLADAISNAKRLTEFDFENPSRGLSQMHLLFEDIGISPTKDGK